MKTLGIQLASALALAFFAAACATTPTETRESALTNSGFRSANASTAQEKALLAQLPADEISKVRRNNEIWFVYPTGRTNNVLVGKQAQYTAYLQRAAAQHVQPAHLSSSKTPVFTGRGGTIWGTDAQATRITR